MEELSYEKSRKKTQLLENYRIFLTTTICGGILHEIFIVPITKPARKRFEKILKIKPAQKNDNKGDKKIDSSQNFSWLWPESANNPKTTDLSKPRMLKEIFSEKDFEIPEGFRKLQSAELQKCFFNKTSGENYYMYYEESLGLSAIRRFKKSAPTLKKGNKIIIIYNNEATLFSILPQKGPLELLVLKQEDTLSKKKANTTKTSWSEKY